MTIVKGFTIKGFTVPYGYELTINQEDTAIVKRSGEQTGGQYTFQQIWQGEVPNWKLVKVVEHNVQINRTKEVDTIIDRIESLGAKCLFVGGAVRDSIMGFSQKDLDIEVYNITADKLISVLEQFGQVNQVGVSFGVIKLRTDENEYDFSLPRTESKSGEGHRGFIVESNPDLSPEEASSRRDFTFNSMAVSSKGELLDFFNGLQDIQNKTLRHTSEKFSEDPLRVLRGFQFAGRFGFTIDPKTAELAKNLKSEYKTLAKDRVWGEFEKWATKSVYPSYGLKVLKDTGWVEFYPELNNMIGVPQDPKWHPEGDVWTHTLYVCDVASEIADREKLNPKDRLVLMFAALLHDIGKPKTTEVEYGKITAHGHEEAGALMVNSFFDRIGAPLDIREPVIHLVKEHMAHKNPPTEKSVRRLSLRLAPTNIKMLIHLIESDVSGRPPLPKQLPEYARDLYVMSESMNISNTKITPLFSGKNLMELANQGLISEKFKKGGTHFGVLLNELFELQLEGQLNTFEEIQNYVIDMFKPDELSSVHFLASLSTPQKVKLLERAKQQGWQSIDALLEQPISVIESLLK